MDSPSQEDICKYVGQLFLESRHTIENINTAAKASVEELKRKLAQAKARSGRERA